METINKILYQHWFTKQSISYICSKIWCNGCGWKWWVDFEMLLKALPYFREDKGKKLLEDLHYLCLLHDYWFYIWWNIIDFLKANFYFAKWIFKLTWRTNILARFLIFVIILISLNIFGIKYFNWE